MTKLAPNPKVYKLAAKLLRPGPPEWIPSIKHYENRCCFAIIEACKRLGYSSQQELDTYYDQFARMFGPFKKTATFQDRRVQRNISSSRHKSHPFWNKLNTDETYAARVTALSLMATIVSNPALPRAYTKRILIAGGNKVLA